MQFLYSHWLSLSIAKRIEIAQEFNIQKKGSTHVVGDRIESDGYLIEDVESALTLDNLQKKLGSDITDMAILWDMLVHSSPVSPEKLAKVVQLEAEPIKTDVITTQTHAKTKKPTKK